MNRLYDNRKTREDCSGASVGAAAQEEAAIQADAARQAQVGTSPLGLTNSCWRLGQRHRSSWLVV